jgi:hypothetical protein
MQSAAQRAKALKTHLESGNYEAHIYVTKSEPAIFHYIVCRKGDPEILHWSQQHTLEAARREAMTYMDELRKRQAS